MTKILVIEDEQPLREDILETLECLYFDAIGAENGAVGVQLAQLHKPDLILCDIMMPELDGYGVFSTLRQNPGTATIPFIFLSAKADKTDLRQGMNLGADDYLTKPFTIAELRDAISTQIQKREKLDSHSQKKLDELRSNITRSLPHELRTPLQGILSLSEILINQYEMMESDIIKEMLGTINTSAQRLSRLIQNFLVYAEIEIMAFDVERIQELQNSQSHSVKQLLTNLAIQKAQQAEREADLQLEVQDIPAQISEIYLHKIADEIIDNAFKFSPVGTPVYIENTSIDSKFILSVINQGQGMTEEQIASVGAYMQFERKLYEQQGSGLGLIIAKRLVEVHGGELSIESTPGEETRVQISLPIPV
ncbi:MAG TPA: hybrid sensor histidine kinase/response regulator [Candidatus Obscuribacterales bacterium]